MIELLRDLWSANMSFGWWNDSYLKKNIFQGKTYIGNTRGYRIDILDVHEKYNTSL